MKQLFNNTKKLLLKPAMSASIFLSLVLIGGISIIAATSTKTNLETLKSNYHDNMLTSDMWNDLIDAIIDLEGNFIGSQRTTNGNMIYYTKGNVGIGTTTPTAKLHVNGGVQIGDTAATCNKAIGGTLKYVDSENCMYFCNGSKWRAMSCNVEVAMEISRYPGCDTNDITIGGYTVAACNVGATYAGLGSSSYGTYFSRNNAQNKCANGYHLPSKDERVGIVGVGGRDNGPAMSNALLLPFAGYCHAEGGGCLIIGDNFYWSATPSDNDNVSAYHLYFSSSAVIADMRSGLRHATPIRCFKNS